MKIVYFGSRNYDEPVLEGLEKKFDLSLIVKSSDINSKEDLEELVKETDAVLGVVANFGHVISKKIIDHFPKGILNVHPSLLPKYRGPTPVQTAILNGDKIAGVTIIKIDEIVDHGPILEQTKEKIKNSDTSETLLKRLFERGAKILPNIISKYIASYIKITKQNEKKATFTQILTKESGFINLNNPPSKEFLKRMIRAFYPWPGTWFRTKISEKKLIVKLLPDKKIQVEGKNPMGYKDFVNGYKEGAEILSRLGLLDPEGITNC